MITASLIASTPNPIAMAAILTHNTSPYVTAYNWSYANGFGSKYSNPGTLPAGGGKNGLTYNRSRSAVAVGFAGSPWVNVYPWNRNSGWGSKYSDPNTLPDISTSNTNGLSFSNDEKALCVAANNNSPYVWAYPWSNSTGWGAKFANPGTLPPSDIRNCVFHPYSQHILLTGGTAPRAGIWNFNTGTGWGTKLTAPATLPASVANQAAWGPTGEYVAMALDSSPYLYAYPFTPSGGWGTKYTDPTSALPSQYGAGCAFNSIGSVVFVSGNLSNATQPQISAFRFTKASGFGTKFANPSTITTSNATNMISVAPDDSAFVMPLGGTPYIAAYKWNNNTGWGTKYSNPASLPAGGGPFKAIYV